MKILDKTNGKTIYESAAWGPLGTPTKEEIQKWCNMPAGEFSALVKQHKKKKTSVNPMREYSILVEKCISDSYRCIVKVHAADYQKAQKMVMDMDKSEFKFDSKPDLSGKEKYVYMSGAGMAETT